MKAWLPTVAFVCNLLSIASSRTELSAAGNGAFENGQYEVAVVYLSEASRFDYPDIGKKLEEALNHIDPVLQMER
jgi:hypothetical protein